ncbi:MAG: antibiotic biosynthesis monooxygenase [Terriglobia bacterium]
MFVHIWRMRARKKRVEDYEKFGRQVTLPSLKKIEGCLGAHFIKLFEARKPEYLWLVFWRDHKALEQARTNPLWREQIKRFEAGKYYKSIPLELVCETVESFSATLAKPKRPSRPAKAAKSAPPEESQAEESVPEELSTPAGAGPAAEGE